MTKEWSVRIEAVHDSGDKRGLEAANRLMHDLREYAAVGSADAKSLEMQLSVEADSLESAVTKSYRAFLNAIRKALSKQSVDIVDLEVETPEHFEAGLNQPELELVGIAELAEMLNVSRARASAIAARRDFPAPHAPLASGPVWIKSNLSRWLEEWRKRPNVRQAPGSGTRTKSGPVLAMAQKSRD